MTKFIVRRVAEVAVALFAITTLIFILLHLTPGGPCGAPPTTASFGSVSASPKFGNCVDFYQLDRPVVDQYLTFIGDYLHGNFGSSLQLDGTPVITIIRYHLPATVLLITVSFLVQQLIALPLGMFAAVRRHSLFDGVFSVLSYIALSTPAYVLGFILLWFVAVGLGWFPAGRASAVELPVFGTGEWLAMLPQDPALLLGDLARHLVLPATTLATVGIALDSRFMRASMLQVLDQEYIRTAKAKGVHRRSIIFKHAFRNALPPIITNMGLYLPALLGSAMVVEYVFTYTGIGYTFTQAIQGANTPVEQAIFLLSTTAVLVANLMADVAYGLADPRVRYG